MSSQLIPLAKAVSDLARILQIIAEKGDTDAVLAEVFSDSLNHERAVVAAGVDRRIHFLNNARHTIANCKEQIDKWTSIKKALTNIIERLEGHTETVIRAFPEVKFKGSDGEFKIVKNGGAQKLTFNFPTEEKTFRHIPLTTHSLYTAEIPARFLTIEPSFCTINTIAVRQALEAGEKLDFAQLEPRGERLSY